MPTTHASTAVAALERLELAVRRAKELAASYAGDGAGGTPRDWYFESAHAVAVDSILARAVARYEHATATACVAYGLYETYSAALAEARLGATASACGEDDEVSALLGAAGETGDEDAA